MALKRTTVFADEDDLAVIKAAAARRGVAEAEIIRDAIHLAAMANRTWDEPFFSDMSSSDMSSSDMSSSDMSSADQRAAPDPTGTALDETWAQQAAAYEETKSAPG